MANQTETRDITGLTGDKLSFRSEDGAQFKEDGAGVLQSRNADNTAFARFQAGRPVTEDDASIKIWSESLTPIIAAQVDTSVSLPTNTAASRWLVVTTAGSGAVIGDLLRDDGGSSGDMEIFGRANGREIFTSAAFSGGTQTFLGTTQYRWNQDTLAWLAVGDVGNLSGVERVVRFAVGTAATTTSSFTPPVGAIFTRSKIDVTTPYDSGTDLILGTNTTNDLLLVGTEAKMNKALTYVFEHDEVNPATEGIRAEVTNTPAAGACIVTVWFSEVNT